MVYAASFVAVVLAVFAVLVLYQLIRLADSVHQSSLTLIRIQGEIGIANARDGHYYEKKAFEAMRKAHPNMDSGDLQSAAIGVKFYREAQAVKY